jgi:type I restriction enzyme S subunit
MCAYKLRDEANDLLDEADTLLHWELGLPQFGEGHIAYLTPPANPREFLPEMPHPRAFTVMASDLGDRLDGSYHVPVIKTATELLNKGRYAPVKLAQFVGKGKIAIPPRFKRIYVTKEHGVPFIRPSHLPQLRLHDMGYISRKTPVLNSLLLNHGEVLITTDGTIGRIALVSSHTSGWAGSNNIARVTYGLTNNCNGYLAAYLNTPYGFHQLAREIYGGVIDHIEIPHIENVWIPAAPVEVQAAIGEKVVQAYEKKDEATLIEQAAIERLESLLENPQPKVAPATPLPRVLVG